MHALCGDVATSAVVVCSGCRRVLALHCSIITTSCPPCTYMHATQDSLGRQQQQQQLSLPASALASIKATAARWLAKKAEDPESREALLAFGSSRLLDFLVTTATEEPSLEQQHAEQAVVRSHTRMHICMHVERYCELPACPRQQQQV